MGVAVEKWTGPASLERAMDAAGALDAFKPGMKVLIKPNVVMGGSPKVPCKGITSSPEIVAAVVNLMRKKGAGEVVIAEGSVQMPTLKLDTAAAFVWSGLAELSEKENFPLIDMNQGPFRTVSLSDGTEIDIAEAVFEADFVVNVPILKTHNQTQTTICLKNLKGCLAMESKKKCHTESVLNRAIAEFNCVIPCHVNVVDALTATEIGPTPTGKTDQVRDMGLILVGKDRLECDVVGSYLLGYDASKVEHIARYAEMRGGSTRYEDVDILGENPADYRMELEWHSAWADDLMEKYEVSGFDMPWYGHTCCSACGFNLWAGFMAFCRGNKGKTFESVRLCAGKEVGPSSEVHHNVLLGKCSIQAFKDVEGVTKIAGCPPDPQKMTKALTKLLCDDV